MNVSDYVVIWRPGNESEFRSDYVTAATNDQTAILEAAWDCYAKECEEPVDRTEIYDLCAILEGHPRLFY